MKFDLAEHRASASEQERIKSLLSLIPLSGDSALDIGARDGYLSRLLADRFKEVTALDLERPSIDDARITSVQGDITRLQFPDNCFDLVLCSEVLEHIPPPLLPTACNEIARVANRIVVVGVPYKQDTRWGRTTCEQCGGINPPWGHVNCFDEVLLRALFSSLKWEESAFVGFTSAQTNSLSTALLDYAGNPYGTYAQEEGCVHCGQPVGKAAARTSSQRLATRVAILINRFQHIFVKSRPNWIHVAFSVL